MHQLRLHFLHPQLSALLLCQVTDEGGEQVAVPDPGFTDLAPGDPFYEEIAWFAQQGITSGFADGEYKPRLSVSRQAMSSWFYRWSSSPPGPFPDPGFSDVAEGDLFYRSISWFAQAGITEGYTDGTFRPTAFVTRQTISAFFQRYLTGA